MKQKFEYVSGKTYRIQEGRGLQQDLCANYITHMVSGDSPKEEMPGTISPNNPPMF